MDARVYDEQRLLHTDAVDHAGHSAINTCQKSGRIAFTNVRLTGLLSGETRLSRCVVHP